MRMKGIRREVSTTPLSSGSASRLRGNNLLGLSREAGACRLSPGDAGHCIHCHFALAVMQPLCPPSRRAGRQGVEPSIRWVQLLKGRQLHLLCPSLNFINIAFALSDTSKILYLHLILGLICGISIILIFLSYFFPSFCSFLSHHFLLHCIIKRKSVEVHCLPLLLHHLLRLAGLPLLLHHLLHFLIHTQLWQMCTQN